MTTKAKKKLDLDVLVAETNNEPFRFTLAGAERELPHVKNLTFPQLDDLDAGRVAKVLPQITDEETTTAVLSLPAFGMEALIEGWLEHAGVNVGELLASLRS